MSEPLLTVRGLVKHFPIKRGIVPRPVGTVKAVDGIDIDVGEGEAVGLVGESGCGKTTAGRCILRLIEPTAGQITFEGQDIRALDRKGLRPWRQKMQIIFQDPFSSLNPRRTVLETIGEALELHGVTSGRDATRKEVQRLLERCGLDPNYVNRYPHEFSGGQRQRIGIARALAPRPKFIVCDEAVSALDVSVQAQILNLLKDLQQELGLSYLFIAHDLAVVKHLCDRVAVMYLGRIVETGECETLFDRPAHPYTRALLSAIPVPRPNRGQKRIVLQGDVPTPIDPPPGCTFHTRCPYADEACTREVPTLQPWDGDRAASCLHLERVAAEADAAAS
jgi:oligopeptide/dipeptide ABC transporter ATP-binding protein